MRKNGIRYFAQSEGPVNLILLKQKLDEQEAFRLQELLVEEPKHIDIKGFNSYQKNDVIGIFGKKDSGYIELGIEIAYQLIVNKTDLQYDKDLQWEDKVEIVHHGGAIIKVTEIEENEKARRQLFLSSVSDHVEFIPEIFVGQFSFRNYNSVANYGARFIRVQSPFSSGKSHVMYQHKVDKVMVIEDVTELEDSAKEIINNFNLYFL